MGEFKVGDKVRVKSWEDICKMTIGDNSERIYGDCHFIKEKKKICGKEVVLKLYDGVHFFIKNSNCVWWEWMLEPCHNNLIHIYTDGTTTTAILKDGKKTVKTAQAKCPPDDTYDFNIGAKLAFGRLMEAENKAVKEVKRKAKVGEWVKVVNAINDVANKYKNGDILQIVSTEYLGLEHLAYYENEVYTYLLKSEYVVLENYTPEKPVEDKSLEVIIDGVKYVKES